MDDSARVRRLALSFPEADEAPHFEATSFRVRKKIFATWGERAAPLVVKLTAEQQAMLTDVRPDVFAAVPGHWGRLGWTGVVTAAADDETLRHALTLAWRNVAPKTLLAKV